MKNKWVIVVGNPSKLNNGDMNIFIAPEKDMYILNGPGGAGMTMSFGLANTIQNFI